MYQLFLWLGGDDLILDLVVGGLRHDFLGEELIFLGVRSTGDDLFRVCVPDSGKCLQVSFTGTVDVE